MGEGLGEGLIIGMKNISGKVRTAASDMGGIVKSGIIKSLSGIGDGYITDVDIQPTIRPVVDMTDVTAGIKNTFDKSQTIGVAMSNAKAAQATYKAPDVSAIYWETRGQKNPAGQMPEVNLPSSITIINHNTVRNDQDIRKINQGLRNMLDKSSSKRGVVPAV